VADVRDGRVEEITRRNAITRLGEGVDSGRELLDGRMARVFSGLEEYRRAIDELEAERTVAVATSAVRDARNGELFQRELRERFGIEARIITGEAEARLTFAGATAERAGGGDPLLVLDIGGGSTEFVVGRAGEDPSFHVSTQAGSVRQTERHISDDPPTREELDALAGDVRGIIEAQVPAAIRSGVRDGVAVAGTPTPLAALDQSLEPHVLRQVHGHRLGLAAPDRTPGRPPGVVILASPGRVSVPWRTDRKIRHIGSGEAASYRRLPPLEPLRPFHGTYLCPS